MDEYEWSAAAARLPAAPDPGKAKKDFSRLGFAPLLFLTLGTALQLGAQFLLSRPGFPDSALLRWGISESSCRITILPRRGSTAV